MIDGTLLPGRPIAWGMVGGGHNSQIGHVHRSAALRDHNFRLVAGAFDIDAARGRRFGEQLGVDVQRCYADYRAMFEAEAGRPDGIRAVSIATPNNTHFEICKAALLSGLHVVCEKPLCFTTAEAKELLELSLARNRMVGVAYGYAGHPLIAQAREMIARGELGDIRIVQMQFSHGFHSEAVEQSSPAARWRMDPAFAGPSYVLGDIGTHPLYLSQVMLPGLKIERLMCSRQSFVSSRAPLEDNAFTLMQYQGGAMGYLWACAVNSGSMHGHKLRVIGARASLEWWDEHPNQLRHEVQGQPAQVLDRGMGYLHPAALQEDRISAGHAEGLFEAWSNLYHRFALAMEATDRRDREALQTILHPDIHAGIEGVRWVENCVRSADAGGIWVDYC
ncbi:MULTISPECIES: Gfo/Idh/MocA family protein [Delftia]|jgi:predicted dehydrogenase|uniref:Gfo/Idh/MocA family oxidoreductase n=2 Tax=Delftia TaxID=80865 RepID=A0AAX3STQ6_9BURK|nr:MULTISPECIES: Gfo/Idh/MocA family oxidoreductase [Delftia]MDH0850897.1 Gfo/Idh/MocA family oxidoreductase [Delftia tsuruhatensis]MPT02772.1 Gfo/Idh/MocA family oxidoreductase [Delftia sp.]MPT53280.1 Gfo/Idh/MocA family oxidoreductase [Delftia sp.]MXN31532.1 gfo/Idh/MocA family oxidoreductase [Delftia sp. CH05]WFF83506.1 Gfo/Idh/MocA family oxidoreductase [Delftia tsuruhatensis]